MENIWEFLPFTDLLSYADTSKVNRIYVQLFIVRTTNDEIRPFCVDPVRFRRVLWDTELVISGSVALASMLPATSRDWKPTDMDVYTTEDRAHIVHQYLTTREKYRPLYVFDSHNPYYNNGGSLKRVVRLVKAKGSKIDLIIVSHKFSITGVCSFYGTHVMNAITGRGLWSAYPKLTIERRSIINASLNPFIFSMSHAVQKCVLKYANRGYEFPINAIIWWRSRHTCNRSFSCPHTARSSLDKGCLVVGAPDNDFQLFVRNNMESVFNGNYRTLWRMGGDRCNLEERAIGAPPYIAEVDDSIVLEDSEDVDD